MTTYRNRVTEAELASIKKLLDETIETLDNCFQYDLANNVRDVLKEVSTRTYGDGGETNFKTTITLSASGRRRVFCSCGWQSRWFATLEDAQRHAATHTATHTGDKS